MYTILSNDYEIAEMAYISLFLSGLVSMNIIKFNLLSKGTGK